jgi:hypothetical protein
MNLLNCTREPYVNNFLFSTFMRVILVFLVFTKVSASAEGNIRILMKNATDGSQDRNITVYTNQKVMVK